jgi:hypothetical protein
MTAVSGFLFDDDDGAGAFDGYPPVDAASAAGDASVEAAAAEPPPRQACSSSVKVGRTCPGIALRAASTAMMGAVPFRNEMINTRNTFK